MRVEPAGRTRRRPVATRSPVVLVLFLAVCGLAPAAAGGAPVAPGRARAVPPVAKRAKLSPRLAALAAPTTVTPLTRAAAPSLPTSGIGSLIRRADGRLLVEIRTSDVGASTLARLRAAGARVVNVSSAYSTITAAVASSSLRTIAADAVCASSERY